ncbi:hypothetical protein Tco_0588286 [Tanacetum coccineum]
MVCMTDVLSHSHALNIVLSLPDDRDLHCITYAYGAIRAENRDPFSTISQLKTRLEKVEKGKSVNTKFDKTNGSQSLLCVTPLNKHAFQKKTNVSKTEENHVVSKPVTLQTSSTKQTGTNQNKNVIKPGMYRVVITQESQTNKTKSALSSTGMNATSRVRRPMSRDSLVAHSILDNSKKAAMHVSFMLGKNKQKVETSANVVQIVMWVVDSGFSKHMTGGRSLLRNFIEKFMGIVRFGNDNLQHYTGFYGKDHFVRLQTVEDLEGDDLLLYDAEMELMNMILLSIPNEIYNSVDACTSAKDMWKRVERLMRRPIQR